MPHRRTSGAKVRSHKIGIGNSRFAKGKQARLQSKKSLNDSFRNDPSPDRHRVKINPPA